MGQAKLHHVNGSRGHEPPTLRSTDINIHVPRIDGRLCSLNVKIRISDMYGQLSIFGDGEIHMFRNKESHANLEVLSGTY